MTDEDGGQPAGDVTPEVGDEICYRSMEGCTVATVESVNNDDYQLDNGKIVPQSCVLEILGHDGGGR